MIIHKAEASDTTTILKLVKKLVDLHHRLDEYYKAAAEYKDLEERIADWFDDKNIAVFIAEDNGSVIAYIRGGIEEAPYYANVKKIGVLNDVFVEEAYRRQKIAEELFLRLEEWFKMKNIKNIELSVDARNETGIVLWKSLGFFEYKLRMRRDI